MNNLTANAAEDTRGLISANPSGAIGTRGKLLYNGGDKPRKKDSKEFEVRKV